MLFLCHYPIHVHQLLRFNCIRLRYILILGIFLVSDSHCVSTVNDNHCVSTRDHIHYCFKINVNESFNMWFGWPNPYICIILCVGQFQHGTQYPFLGIYFSKLGLDKGYRWMVKPLSLLVPLREAHSSHYGYFRYTQSRIDDALYYL